MLSSMPTVEAIAPSFFVQDLDRSIEWYVRVLGFQIAWKAADRPEYGMREAAVRDPDGNDIYIGQDL